MDRVQGGYGATPALQDESGTINSYNVSTVVTRTARDRGRNRGMFTM